MGDSTEVATGLGIAAQRRFERNGRIKWMALAVVMAGIWFLANPDRPSDEERAAWQKVRAAQLHMADWRRQSGTASQPEADPWDCGLIGIEWSGITTTLGDLEAKRTACNPAWSIRLLRWFDELSFQAGDPIAIYASGSFPGLLLNTLVAAEARDLDILLIVSLGASTWGANHPDAPWPVLATELRRAGFIRTRADFYTLGGGSEMGHGLAAENVALLRQAAAEAGVDLLEADGLAKMRAMKFDLLEQHQPRLLVNIGGAQTSLGDDPAVLELGPGLLQPTGKKPTGNGVISFTLERGTPVLHLLDMKRLAASTGIAFDTGPRRMEPALASLPWSAIGLIAFVTALLSHSRWRKQPRPHRSKGHIENPGSQADSRSTAQK